MRREFLPTILSAAFFLVFIPSVAKPQDTLNCHSERSQHEINQCARLTRKKADDEMNRVYKQQLTYLSAENKAPLVESQRAWIVYRDKTCSYEAGPSEGSGSRWSQIMDDCDARITKQRTDILSQYVRCRENGCPY